jgi:hypothetical protein
MEGLARWLVYVGVLVVLIIVIALFKNPRLFE